MMLSLDEAKILREAVSGIPEVTRIVVGTPAQHRAIALRAAEHRYQKMLLEAGCSRADAQRWAETVIDRIRRQVTEHDQEKRQLKALHDELVMLGEESERSLESQQSGSIDNDETMNRMYGSATSHKIASQLRDDASNYLRLTLVKLKTWRRTAVHRLDLSAAEPSASDDEVDWRSRDA